MVLKLIISKGHYSAKKNVAEVMVFIFYTSSDAVYTISSFMKIYLTVYNL